MGSPIRHFTCINSRVNWGSTSFSPKTGRSARSWLPASDREVQLSALLAATVVAESPWLALDFCVQASFGRNRAPNNPINSHRQFHPVFTHTIQFHAGRTSQDGQSEMTT